MALQTWLYLLLEKCIHNFFFIIIYLKNKLFTCSRGVMLEN